MKPWAESPNFAEMSLEDLLIHWSGMLLWSGMRPMFQRLSDARLTFTEHIVLQSLAHGDLSVGGVAECLSCSHSVASRAVDRLVEAGFVRREENPEDRRQKHLSLAPAGEELVFAVERAIAQGIRPLVAGLSEAEQEQFRTLLGHILRAQCPTPSDTAATAAPAPVGL